MPLVIISFTFKYIQNIKIYLATYHQSSHWRLKTIPLDSQIVDSRGGGQILWFCQGATSKAENI